MLMKKFLLSLAVMALGATAVNATEYTIFSAPEGSGWTATAEKGFNTTKTVDGKSFEINYEKGSYTNDLRNPGTESYSWRVYKGSLFTITSSDVTIKSVIITYDDTSNSQYVGEATLSDGWNGVLNGSVYTVTNATGSNTFKFTATDKQLRISKIVISDQVVEATTTPDPEPTPADAVSVKSVSEMKALANKTAVKVDCDLTVAFVNNNNVFVCDAAGDFIQIYGKNSYEYNDIIPAGWEATYELYNDVTPELMPTGTLPAASASGNFVAKAVPASDITTSLVNSVIVVKNVVLAAASPATKDNFTGKVGETELSFRNNYTLESVEAGTYDITVLVQVYNGAPSLYVINYAKPSAVAELEADENAEAVYYNLQGVKVAEPETGLYIKVQGKKATKVFVRK